MKIPRWVTALTVDRLKMKRQLERWFQGFGLDGRKWQVGTGRLGRPWGRQKGRQLGAGAREPGGLGLDHVQVGGKAAGLQEGGEDRCCFVGIGNGQ